MRNLLLVACLLIAPAAAAATFQNRTLRLTLPDAEIGDLQSIRTDRGLVLAAGSLAILLPNDPAADEASLQARVGPGPALQYMQLTGVRLGARMMPTRDDMHVLQAVAVVQRDGVSVPMLIEIEDQMDDMPAGEALAELVSALAAGTQIVAPDPASDSLADAAPIPLEPHRILAAKGLPPVGRAVAAGAAGDPAPADPGRPLAGTWFGMRTSQDVINGFQAWPMVIAFDPRGWFIDAARGVLTPDVPDAAIRAGLAANPDAGGTYTADAGGVTFRGADGGITRAPFGTDATGEPTLTVAGIVLIEKNPPADGTPLNGNWFRASGTQMGAGDNQSNTLDRTDLTFTADGRYRRRGMQMRSVGSDWMGDVRVSSAKQQSDIEAGAYRIDAGVLTLTPDDAGVNPLDDGSVKLPMIDLNGDLLIAGELFHKADN